MKYKIIIIICCLITLSGYPQQHFTISGYIKDKNTGEVLIGASIFEESQKKGAATNGYGFYSFSCFPNFFCIQFLSVK